jgi:mannose/fructose/N-acetylgalactosamine-specific phosphotransferase system component IIC
VIEQILKISLLGGLLNLDDVPLIQVMISQPIVAAPLIGWIFGDLKAGLVIGAFLELLMVYLLPIGCAVPIDGSLAAIIATGIFLLVEPSFSGQREALIGLAIALALPFAALAQRVSVSVRRLNGKISDHAQRMVLDEKLRKIDLLHLSGVGLFYLRSFSLCLISLLITVPIITRSAHFLPQGLFRGLKLLYFAYPMIGIALIFDTFRNRAIYWLFALSFLLATLFSTFLPLPAWAAFGVPCVILGTLFGMQEALRGK